jgi:ketosteroid isomerase-like protein
MSQTIAERLGELYSEWARGNFRAGATLIAPDAILEPPLAEGEFRLRGAEEIRAYLSELLAGWDELRVEAREIVDGETATVVSELHRGRRAGDRSETELRFYAVWAFAGDRATRVRWESDRARALELAGVREHSETWRQGYSSTAGLPFDRVARGDAPDGIRPARVVASEPHRRRAGARVRDHGLAPGSPRLRTRLDQGTTFRFNRRPAQARCRPDP